MRSLKSYKMNVSIHRNERFGIRIKDGIKDEKKNSVFYSLNPYNGIRAVDCTKKLLSWTKRTFFSARNCIINSICLLFTVFAKILLAGKEREAKDIQLVFENFFDSYIFMEFQDLLSAKHTLTMVVCSITS